jgi:hypothetical protein
MILLFGGSDFFLMLPEAASVSQGTVQETGDSAIWPAVPSNVFDPFSQPRSWTAERTCSSVDSRALSMVHHLHFRLARGSHPRTNCCSVSRRPKKAHRFISDGHDLRLQAPDIQPGSQDDDEMEVRSCWTRVRVVRAG